MNNSPLIIPAFRRMFAAQLIALFGTGLSTIALALLALELAEEKAGLVLGAALALKMITYVFFSPVFAALCAGRDRKSMLVTLDVIRAITLIAMLFVSQIWQIFILIFIINACSAGFTPLFQATIPQIVKDDAQYTRALALSRLAYDLENIISPLAAAALLLVLSWNLLFGLNALAFVISAFLILTTQFSDPDITSKPARSVGEILAGVKSYLKTPRLRGLLALSFAVSSAGSMVIVNSVVIVNAMQSTVGSKLAIVFAAFGFGSMVVAFLMLKFTNKYGERAIMLTGGVLLTLGMFAGVMIESYETLIIVWFILGVGNSMVLTPSGQLLKRSAHAQYRAQIFSAQFALSHFCWLISYPLAGWMGFNLAMDTAFIVMGVLALFSTVVALYLWSPGTSAKLEHSHPEHSHAHFHIHDEHHQHNHEGWEGPEPHEHPHFHAAKRHAHAFVIDDHHHVWPR